MKKIGIMLGVFNPPHNFHFTIANEILKNNPDIEKIIFVPTNNQYNKLPSLQTYFHYGLESFKYPLFRNT